MADVRLLQTGDFRLLETGDVRLLEAGLTGFGLGYGNRYATKPPPGTNLDTLHPLCPDYCWPFLSPQGSPQVLTRRKKVVGEVSSVYVGGGKMVPGRKYGWSARHTSTTDIIKLTTTGADCDAVLGLSGGFTVLICYRKTDTTNRAATAFGANGSLSGTDACNVILPYSDGVVYWDYGGQVAGTSRLSVSGLTFGDDLWVCTTGSRGMDIWQNGIRRASQAGFASRTGSSFYLGMPCGTPNFADLADIALVMTWRRQLSSTEILQLSSNPWQIFAPVSVFYSVGVSSSAAINGTASFTLPSINLSATASGTAAVVGTAALTLNSVGVTATANISTVIHGTAALGLGTATVAATGIIQRVALGNLHRTLAPATMHATSTLGGVGSLYNLTGQIRSDGGGLLVFMGLPNRSIEWRILEGAGTLMPFTTYTDAWGRATARFDAVSVGRVVVGVAFVR